MELVELCNNLFTVLEQFDEAVLPFGLYASDDLVENTKKSKLPRQEWYAAIAPYLQKQNCLVGNLSNINYNAYRTWFYMPNCDFIKLTIVRFSSVKVRKYGSNYRVDIHEGRSMRWKGATLGGRISKLWKLPESETELISEEK